MKNSQKREDIYTTLAFIEELRTSIQKIVSSKVLYKERLSNQNFSIILGQSKKYIENLKHKMKYTSPDFIIALDKLEIFKNNIQSRFKERSTNEIKIIEKYIKLNKLPRFTGKTFKYHPNLERDYFKTIDTKEKAYWLGWLFAEGWIESPKPDKDHSIGVGLNKKDEIQLQHFIKTIGYNPKYIRFKKDRVRTKNYEEANYLEIGFQCLEFKNHLVNYGLIVGKAKSKNIELPRLSSRYLYLAFLLGFFDGDGDQGTSLINTGSKIFLKQIKEYFNLDFKIGYKTSIGGYIEGRFVKGSVYRMSLGAKLFNEMLENYKKSLQRKRIWLQSKEEKIKRAIELANKKKKLMFTKEELEELIWKMSMVKIAKKHEDIYGIKINNRTIGKYVEKWNIKKPPHGFWNKKKIT